MPEFSEPPSVNGSALKKDSPTAYTMQSPENLNSIPAINGHSSSQDENTKSNGDHAHPQKTKGIWQKLLRPFLRSRQDASLRAVIEEAIENDHSEDDENPQTASHERLLISNILNLRDLTAVDVMIPRADIIAIDQSISQEDLLTMLSKVQKSRFPVYKDTMDDVIGTIHIKDILAAMAQNKEVNINDLIREVPIVAPSIPVLDLLVEMRESRKHMALVVDEYGGIDGLMTIGDIIEAIIGEIDDEYDHLKHPKVLEHSDGSIIADGRVDIDEFEERYGVSFSEDEHEDADTLGGLVFTLAGRVPARGEVLLHDSGMEFEVMDADPRRIHRLKIRNIPENTE